MNNTGHVSGRISDGTIHDWRNLVYKNGPADVSVYDCPTVFFDADFIRRPCFGWTVDYDGAHCHWARTGHVCHENCMAGVLVKHPDPQRVWRLTGEADRNTDRLAYEGRWPD